jgi:cytochrome c oxidase subunit II
MLPAETGIFPGDRKWYHEKKVKKGARCMKKNRRVLLAAGVFALGMALAGCGSDSNHAAAPSNTANSTPAKSASNAAASAGTGHEQTVKVIATNYKWTLDKTEVKAGQPVKFVISDKEGAHGFAIAGTDVNQALTPGSDTVVTWTPDKPGTYTIYCSQMCGIGHGDMHTTITVK